LVGEKWANFRKRYEKQQKLPKDTQSKIRKNPELPTFTRNHLKLRKAFRSIRNAYVSGSNPRTESKSFSRFSGFSLFVLISVLCNTYISDSGLINV